MKISVIMATFNGMDKHLKEQLDSLKSQSYKNFKVYIQDDRSDDGTLEFIESYIKINQLDNWIVFQNQINMGWRNNFFSLMKRVDSDIIFVSDQDDIWDEKKIEEMTNIMVDNASIYTLACLPRFINEDGKLKNDISLQEYDYEVAGDLQKLLFTTKNIMGFLPGCTFAIRKELLPYIFKVYNRDEEVNHDAIIQFSATALGKMYLYPKTLHSWRKQESSTMVSENKISRLRALQSATNAWKFAINFINEYSSEISWNTQKNILINYCDYQYKLLKSYCSLGNSRYINNRISQEILKLYVRSRLLVGKYARYKQR